jgi:TANFOR domain-containing protein
MNTVFKSFMMKHLHHNRTLFLIIIVMMMRIHVSGQSGPGLVDIRISIFPPYPSRISEYASRPQQVLILVHNLSNVPEDIQLRGSITGDNGIVLRVNPQYRSPGPIHLNPGEIRNLNASDITQLFDYSQLIFSGITKDQVVRGNGLPEGNYQVCVQAFNYNTNQPVSQTEPSGCSNVFPISNVEPPYIITPFNDQPVSAQTTQNFVITWSTPAGSPPSTQYTVEIVENFDNRNPNDAINSAVNPVFFKQTVTATNLLLYGPAMPALTPGRRYALMVVAKDPFNAVTFRNGGRSEVIGFTYGNPDASSGTAGASTGTNNSNLPSITIKGKIDWYYRKSEETSPVGKTAYTPNAKNNYAMQISGHSQILVNAAYSDPSFVATVKPVTMILNNPSANTSSSMYSMASLKSTPPSAPVVPSTLKQLSKISPYAMSIIGGGSTLNSNSSNPAFFNQYGSESHPLANTIIKLLATDTTQPYSAPVMIGAAESDADGNFQLAFIPPSSFNNTKGYKYSIGTQNNYFSLPTVSFSIPAGATSYDLGELKALANTFRLTGFATNASDSELVHASILIYRRTDFYTNNPALKTEGNANENNRIGQNIDGQNYIQVGTINDGYTCSRLFFSGGSDEDYKILVTADHYSTFHTSLSISSSNSNPTSPETIQQAYQLTTSPNTLSGQVWKILEQSGQKQAVPGALVTLYLTDDAYNRATQSAHSMMALAPNKNIVALNQNASGATQPAGIIHKPTSEELTINKNISPIVNKTNPTGGQAREMKTVLPSDVINSVSYIIGDQMTTTTDSSGNFTISNIPEEPKLLKFIVKMPGSDASLTDSSSAQFNGKGIQISVSEVFKFRSYAVTGRVVDENKNPLVARYNWASGGSESQTSNDGYIASFHEAGTDTLIIVKLGYDTIRYPVTIKGDLLDKTPVASSGNKVLKIMLIPQNKLTNDAATNYMTGVQSTPTYQASVTQGSPMSAQTFGFTSSTKASASAWEKSIVKPQENPTGAVDVGTLEMIKASGRMLIRITDNNNNPINHASIQIVGTDSTEYTDNNGNRFIQGPSGSLLLTISDPGSAYATQQVAVNVSDFDTTRKTIQLKPGIIVSGSVKANGSAVPAAKIAVDGMDYIQSTSATDGSYSIVIPSGDYTLRASKSGFVSDPHEQTFTAKTTLNFTLGTAGFDITKILGFSVEIDQIQDIDATHKKLTGSLVSLPANAVFALSSGGSIPFSNLEVEIKNNIPVPLNGVINTDATELSVKAFHFLPLKCTNGGNGIVVRQTGTAGDAGEIEAMPAIDYSSFVPSGIAPYVDATTKQYIQNQSGAAAQSIPLIISTGTLSSTSLYISGTSQSFNLYGFQVTLDLANSSVKADGLHLKGNIKLNNIPMISATSFQIQDLSIGTNGYVSNVSVNMTPPPTFQIASWSASLTGLSFNDNGFSISGNVHVQIPGSQASEINFANLNISTDQLYGGSFTIPSSGIDVFGIVKFMGGSTPLSFGKVGSSNVYYIGGSGTIQFPSLFGNMTLQFFQIQTDGQFTATAATNINEDFFGLANVQVTDVGFNTINGVSVNIKGNFQLNAIPFLKASVGGIHFGPGGAVSVDDIGLSFDMAGVASVSANIAFVNQSDKKGFSGDGSITVIGLPGAEIGFSYYKLPNGVSVSANFKANIIIPIGAIVSINNPGGGFSLNTADHTWLVNINGDVSVTGVGTAVNIKINVTVTNGPVITGTAGLNVLTINLANAAVCLDVPKSLFTININAEIDLIPKVITSEGSAIFTLSAAKNDTYFMIAAQYQSSLLGIFDEKVHIAAGWGLNVNNHPEYAEYTSFIDPNFLDNGILKGISLSATSNINFKATGDIYIASGSIWYKNNGIVKLNMGIGAGNYGLDISASWDCGASISVSPFGTIAGVDIGSDAGIHLDYSNGCFSVGGELAAHLMASIGDCDDDCFTGICTDYDIPSGGKICVHPGLKVGYDCNSGFSFGIDL